MPLRIYAYKSYLKTIFFLAGMAIAIGMVVYIQMIVYDQRNENRQAQELYANFLSKLSEFNLGEFNLIYQELIQKSYFPMVVTDAEGNPAAWRGIGVDEYDSSPEAIREIKKIIKMLDRVSEPIPLKYDGKILMYFHYGDPDSVQALQTLPYVQLLFIGLFVLLGYMGYNNVRRAEQRFIWVGMAKETAHQLGTPISSLMGWVAFLGPKLNDQPYMQKAFMEINNDVERLNKIAQRFSHIGSAPDLSLEDLKGIIHGVVEYFRRRLPQMKKRVDIIEQFGDSRPVPLNKELFEWVLENLIKNSLDAIDRDKGRIEIALSANHHEKSVFIDIVDNGKGISKKNWKIIFRPGFSSKKRGWGLGLSLAKRIVEEYHRGKLFVEDSKQGEGTTIRIKLPMGKVPRKRRA